MMLSEEWTNGARAPCSPVFEKNENDTWKFQKKNETKNLYVDHYDI
jgi:hypothetical protein